MHLLQGNKDGGGGGGGGVPNLQNGWRWGRQNHSLPMIFKDLW